ncbi:metallophosphoesterase [Oscillatoria sp. CS-180]|uniref:metallophosphoesterase family protein n=1 Tax=Oscillatoria sp. CS-180 TaxID=3021720 RepID=UPI00232E6EC3|nr:metallophosphoesterase [Oscillatoria sp. CS-180]MDB9526582.1 metallophosphoesterase [Oscillatoria sp. CS-180]
MGLLLDPPTSTKVQRMRSRVRWGARQVQDRGIDQTRLKIADGLAQTSAFSFLVIGDTGFGPQPFGHPQREIAQSLAEQMEECRFLLHTGDVVYQMGSPDQYPANFIEPYQEWLVGGERSDCLEYRNLVFKKPFLTVPGNHDYYNVPLPYGLLVAAVRPLRKYLKVPVTDNVSLRGSASGDAYARAFLDYLKDLSGNDLENHLEQHYASETDTGFALTYQPGEFTSLPNRYYHFRYGDIDFIGLDSSTFNRPVDVDGATVLKAEEPSGDLSTELDWAQLFWLRDRLINSLRNPQIRGRILYFHHPPYVTEGSKYHDVSCLSARRHLRWVMDAVAEKLGAQHHEPLVDLVLSGHAHCFEYLRTVETGHADRCLNWIVCGGSGARLRAQHGETTLRENNGTEGPVIAKSQLFMGRWGIGSDTHWPYSFLRIDVRAGDRPKFVIRPFITELYRDTWTRTEFDPLVL